MSTYNRRQNVGRIDRFSDDGAQRSAPPEPARALSQVLRQKLDEASRAQEELAESRERLLVEREKLRSSGSRVRAQRIETGDMEVVYMDSLRQFVNEHISIFPPPLIAAFQRVVDAHEKLRAMEEDYLQAERSLGGLEWTVMNEETDFYQGHALDLSLGDDDEDIHQHSSKDEPLVPPREELQSIRPPAAVNQEYHDALAQLDGLRRQFDALRDQQAAHLDATNLRSPSGRGEQHDDTIRRDFETHYFHLLEKISACEVQVQRLKQDSMHHEALATVASRRNSDPVDLGKPSPLTFDIITRAHTDSAIPTLLNDSKTKQRIRDWLLDYLQHNALQKALYMNILGKFGIVQSDIEPWEDCATQFWPIDSSEQSCRAAEDPLSVTDNSSQGTDRGQLSSISKQGRINGLLYNHPSPVSEDYNDSEPVDIPMPNAMATEPDSKNAHDCRELSLSRRRDRDARVDFETDYTPPMLPSSRITPTNFVIEAASVDLPPQRPITASNMEAQRYKAPTQQLQPDGQMPIQKPHTTEVEGSSVKPTQYLHSPSYTPYDSIAQDRPMEPIGNKVALQQKGLWQEDGTQEDQRMALCGKETAAIKTHENSEKRERRLFPGETKDTSTMTKQESPTSTSNNAASTHVHRPLRLSASTPPSMPSRPVSEHMEKGRETFSDWLRLTLKHSKSKSTSAVPRIRDGKDYMSKHTSPPTLPPTASKVSQHLIHTPPNNYTVLELRSGNFYFRPGIQDFEQDKLANF